jgi:AcrR family transcriptional regulator
MDKKQKIILAAISEFAKNGFEKASMDAVAVKAKVAKGTVFYHFKSKSDLFADIVDEGQKKLEKKIKKEIEGLESNKDKIEKIIDIEVNFIKKYHDLFLVYLGDVVKKTISFEVINKVIDNGKKTGEFRKDLDVETASLGLFWMTAMICLNTKKVDSCEIKKMVIGGIKLD